MHRFDGAEQYFTRAVDFGYSFSIDETFEKWGRQEILGDFVRLIRTIRPTSIVAHARPTARAAASTTRRRPSSRARRSSRPATRRSSPSRLREGLRPWQPKKFYFTGRFGFPGEPAPRRRREADARSTPGAYDPLLGAAVRRDRQPARSIPQVPGHGAAARRCPARRAQATSWRETAIPGLKEKGEASLFDGIDTSPAGPGALRARRRPPAALDSGAAGDCRRT